MCLLITAFAAVIATIIWFFQPDFSKIAKLGTLALMYWGAALMWTVDGFFSVSEGGDFLDLSLNDAVLGMVIILCGLIVWMIILFLHNPQRMISAVHHTDNL